MASSTGSNNIVLAAATGVLIISACPSAFVAGTGGTNHPELFREIGRRAGLYDGLANAAAAPRLMPAADDIEFIKGALRLTVSELAKYLGVSRQAIYDWKSGAHIKSHNVSKLENMKSAADVLVSANETASAVTLNRKLPGGRTLLETIAAGGNGHEAAQSLVNMLQRENSRRKELKTKLAGLKPLRSSKFAGIATMPSERT